VPLDNHLNAQYHNKAMITQGMSALMTQRERRRTNAEKTTRLVIAVASSIMYSHRGIRDMDSEFVALPF